MDSMKRQDEGLKKQTSNMYAESNTKSTQSSNSKNIEIGADKNYLMSLKKDAYAKSITNGKNDISDNDLNTELMNLSNASIKVDALQLLENFVDVFEPIHIDKVLLCKIKTKE